MEENVDNENPEMETWFRQFAERKNQLTIFPHTPSSFSDEPEIMSNLFNKFSIDLLNYEAYSGFLICESDPPNTTSEISKYRQSCLFIPAPNYSRIVLIKSIHSFRDSLETAIRDPIVSQLNQLNLTFKNERAEKIPIVILIVFIVKKTGKEESENCEKIFAQITEFNTKDFEKLDIEFVFLLKNKNTNPGLDLKTEKKKLKQAILVPGENLETKKSIFKFLRTHDAEVDLQITTKNFKKIGSAEITLTDFDEVVYMYKLYFPAKDHSLEMLPSMMGLTDTLLYKTGERGELLQNCEGYIGEQKDFWGSYIAKLCNPVGLLIKAYSDVQINTILRRPVFNNHFDIDWIYCGHKVILAIEVGRTNSPDCPIYTIVNKLEQVLCKNLPTMYLALHAIFRSFPENFSRNEHDTSIRFWSFVKKRFRFVIFFPNLSAQAFRQILQTAREPLDNVAKQKAVAYRNIFGLISTAKENRLSSILFLMHEDLHSTTTPKTFYVEKDLNVLESRMQITEILQAKVNYRKLRPKYKRLEFVSGIFAFSTLIRKEIFPSTDSADKTLISRDQKYLQDQKRFLKQTKFQVNESDFLDVVLSPQQHRILSENKRRVLIAGEPGSGKTALLLARAKISARDPNIEHIMFAIPEEKTEFKKFLLDFVDKPGNEGLKTKFIMVTIEEMSDPSLRRPDW